MPSKKLVFNGDIELLFNRNLAKALVETISRFPEAEGGKGGFLSLWSDDLNAMTTMAFGTIPVDKISCYHRNSTEKVSRLLKYPPDFSEDVRRLLMNPPHRKSFQKRGEELEMDGGAIRIGPTIVSFYGFTEKLDEALCLMYFYCNKNGSYDSYELFTEKLRETWFLFFSDNDLVMKVAEAFEDSYNAIY